jgi:hypothetical protein
MNCPRPFSAKQFFPQQRAMSVVRQKTRIAPPKLPEPVWLQERNDVLRTFRLAAAAEM